MFFHKFRFKSSNINETWSNLTKGVSGVDTISSFDPEGYETTFAAEATGFDPETYVDKKQARRMDRFVQLAAAASLEAFEDSGLSIDESNADRVSVIKECFQNMSPQLWAAAVHQKDTQIP